MLWLIRVIFLVFVLFVGARQQIYTFTASIAYPLLTTQDGWGGKASFAHPQKH